MQLGVLKLVLNGGRRRSVKSLWPSPCWCNERQSECATFPKMLLGMRLMLSESISPTGHRSAAALRPAMAYLGRGPPAPRAGSRLPRIHYRAGARRQRQSLQSHPRRLGCGGAAGLTSGGRGVTPATWLPSARGCTDAEHYGTPRTTGSMKKPSCCLAIRARTTIACRLPFRARIRTLHTIGRHCWRQPRTLARSTHVTVDAITMGLIDSPCYAKRSRTQKGVDQMEELNGRMIACQILITGLIAKVATIPKIH